MFDPGYRKKYNHPRQGLGYREGSVKGTIIKDLVFLNHEAQLFVCSGHQTPTPVRSSGQNLDYNVGRVCYPILSSTRLASRLGQSPCDHWTPKGLKPETNRTPDRTNLQQIKVILFGYGLSFSMSICLSYKAMGLLCREIYGTMRRHRCCLVRR
ncbi:hypothetical protein V6N11_056397 [Hibiscus sabdariffa]|uniref:Uncharacterized protein n=1 Tax=Hibiscus sabdariffa TaxID=183260 RepID=A0ABR2T3Y5_9ROSI